MKAILQKAAMRQALEMRGPSTVRTRTGQGFATAAGKGTVRRAPARRLQPAGKMTPPGSTQRAPLAVPDKHLTLSARDRMMLESGGIMGPRYSEEQIRQMRERAALFNERGEQETGTDAEAEQKARESDAAKQFANDDAGNVLPDAEFGSSKLPWILAAVAGYLLFGG